MRTHNQRAAILTLLRELKNGVKKAINDGYYIEEDSGKINLLRHSQKTGIPQKLEQLWKLEFDQPLPSSDEELLKSLIVKEILTPQTTPKERRNK
jgi:hypothetical protein